MILPIYTYGQPVLRDEAVNIDSNYPNLKELLDNMFQTMNHADGVGLAAPQVGLPIRLFVVTLEALADENPEYKGFNKVFINPEILEEDEEECSMEEGCLSVPGIHESVKRPVSIKVKYLDENFVEHEEVLEGFLARVFQHEYDHLEGQLFIDHLSVLRKQMIKGKLSVILKGKARTSYKMKQVKA